MGVIRVKLTPRDLAKLQKGVTAQGGIQSLIRRLQAGVRVIKGEQAGWLTVDVNDLPRIVKYWKATGGKPGSGGYQQRLPVESLRAYLPSVAPLFADPIQAPLAPSWVYFKRQKYGDGRIKIGQSSGARARQVRPTDNPHQLVLLLLLPQPPPERFYHEKFHRLRCAPDREWFWPGDELLEFIEQNRKSA